MHRDASSVRSQNIQSVSHAAISKMRDVWDPILADSYELLTDLGCYIILSAMLISLGCKTILFC